VQFQLTFNSNTQQRIWQTTEYCITALVLTYLQFICIKVKVPPKFTQRHCCLCSPTLFSSVSNKLAFAMTWSFCFCDQQYAGRTQKNPFQRTPDLQAWQECLERWGTVCHKCSLGCSRSSSYQKHKLRGDDLSPPTCTWTTDCQFQSPCSVTCYGPRIWFLCAHSIFFRFFYLF